LRRLAVLVPILVCIGVYGTHAGHGFVQDDYAWVLQSRAHSLGAVARLFASDNGFYRPIVSLSFAVDEWLFGSAPLGYGLTNMVLALGCAAAVAVLIRDVGLPRGAATFGALVWLMNFYFTRTTILWISGRTALLVTLAGVLAASALLRRQPAIALVWLAVALLAKEEAVLLPFILAAWLALLDVDSTSRRRRILVWLAGAAAVLALYFVARSHTSAMTPASAPPYYRFTFDPAAVWRNVREYADRTSTLAVTSTLVATLILGWPRHVAAPIAGRAIAAGVVWLVLGLGFAYFLPVRSDLYAAMPAVGSSLVASAVVFWLWSNAKPPAHRRALVVATAASVCLAPVYWTRTTRMTHVAEFSAARLVELVALTRDLPAGARVRVDDVESTDPRSPNLAAAFGSGLAEALTVAIGRPIDAVLVDPTSPTPAEGPFDRRLRLDHGKVIQ
jgi:hypothetical protein